MAIASRGRGLAAAGIINRFSSRSPLRAFMAKLKPQVANVRASGACPRLYSSILIGFFIKTIAIIATFLLLNYGLKGFVTGLLVFLMGGGYLDLDPRDIMTIDALAVIFSFITGIWGVWVVRRLMSKKYYTLPRTKITFGF